MEGSSGTSPSPSPLLARYLHPPQFSPLPRGTSLPPPRPSAPLPKSPRVPSQVTIIQCRPSEPSQPGQTKPPPKWLSPSKRHQKAHARGLHHHLRYNQPAPEPPAPGPLLFSSFSPPKHSNKHTHTQADSFPSRNQLTNPFNPSTAANCPSTRHSQLQPTNKHTQIFRSRHPFPRSLQSPRRFPTSSTREFLFIANSLLRSPTNPSQGSPPVRRSPLLSRHWRSIGLDRNSVNRSLPN